MNDITKYVAVRRDIFAIVVLQVFQHVALRYDDSCRDVRLALLLMGDEIFVQRYRNVTRLVVPVRDVACMLIQLQANFVTNYTNLQRIDQE